MSKICRTCKRDLDESLFDKHAKSLDGVRQVCKECRSIYQKPRNAAIEIVEAPQARFNGKTQAEILAMAIELRMEYYRDGAIEAIFDLAMMPPSKNTLSNSIKLQAARLLAGPLPGDATAKAGEPVQPLENLLQSLNEAYHKNAPRIREVRERVMTFEQEKEALPAP